MEEIYKNHKINTEGFRGFAIDASIAKFEIYNKSQRSLVVFALTRIDLYKCDKQEEELSKECRNIIKDLIDKGIKDDKYYEYQNCAFEEVKNPTWWKR